MTRRSLRPPEKADFTGLDKLISNHDQWHYERADLEQGAYCRLDHKGEKCAVILPWDRTTPIEHGTNARLYFRNFRSQNWIQEPEPYSFQTAKNIGDWLVSNMYARDVAEHIKARQAEGRLKPNEQETDFLDHMRRHSLDTKRQKIAAGIKTAIAKTFRRQSGRRRDDDRDDDR